MYYLVILESPAKRSKISKFLNSIEGHKFVVEASFGHIREFKQGLKSIDFENNYKPTFKITASKRKVVSKLRKLAKEVDQVIIATDLDREGEAIGYHLIETLGLSIDKTKRMIFNEITKKAITKAFHNLTTLDMKLVRAQMARSIIDLIIGYTISPLLWSIQHRLSAGRCQSPALRLICERENEIEMFTPISSFQIVGKFPVIKNDTKLIIEAKYQNKPKKNTKIKQLLSILFPLQYHLSLKEKKQQTQNPPPPYITSTIQQDASSIYKMSPKSTMMHLQKLYEEGKITYMRTDSVVISEQCQNECKQYLKENYPEEKFVKRVYKSKVANAQEAHECIRPVKMELHPDTISNPTHKKLYSLIWNRTLSCFLPSYKKDVFHYEYVSECKQYTFVFLLNKTTQLGYKILSNSPVKDDSKLLQKIQIPFDTNPTCISALETFSKPKPRYSEAQLIKQLETLGIGRPSTFSNIVNTLFTRDYIKKEMSHNKLKTKTKELSIVKKNQVVEKMIEKLSTSQKGKLFPTSLGSEVNEFLTTNYKLIDSYPYTKKINEKLDKIATGTQTWTDVIDKVYHPLIRKTNNLKKNTPAVNTKGKEIKSIKDESYGVTKDKWGFVLTRLSDNEQRRIKFKKDLTEEKIIEVFMFPIVVGTYKSETIKIKKGPYGMYATINKINISVKSKDITLKEIIQLYEDKKKQCYS